MVKSDYILAPRIVKVSFGVEPVYNALESIGELGQTGHFSGFADWVVQTAAALPTERKQISFAIFDAMDFIFHNIFPPGVRYKDLMSYVDDLAKQDPVRLRDQVVQELFCMPQRYPEVWEGHNVPQAPEQLLESRDVYLDLMRTAWTVEEDEARHLEHDLLNDPHTMLQVVVEHLRYMWYNYVAEEWERVLPMLQESVSAFQRLDFSNMTANEAMRIATGRELGEKLAQKLEGVEDLIFVPSAHIGPYISKFKTGTVFRLLFGARLPRGVEVASSALSRSELLVRMNALADDTRLRILELLTRQDELCAQDIIEQLGLSQSSVSRHLSQLSATGYITERRREVSKCYSLNTDRVVDTLRALTNFLSRQ